MSWKIEDWPDERIKAVGDLVSKWAPGLQWCWDPSYSEPRFRAFAEGPFMLVIYAETGTWFLEKNGEEIAEGHEPPSVEVGIQELYAVYRSRNSRVFRKREPIQPRLEAPEPEPDDEIGS